MPSRVIMSRANAKTPQNARAGRPRRRFDSMPALDVGLQARGHALHVDEQAADEGGRDEREDPLPERLVDGPGKKQARGRSR